LKQDLTSGFNINNKLTSTSANGIATADLGDVDGDGQDELAVVGVNVKVVSVLQCISGTIRTTHNFTAGGGDVRVALTDCDGDGRADVLFSSPGSASLSIVHQNNLAPEASAHCLDDWKVEGYNVRFEANSSTDSYADLDTLIFNWTFPDGSYGEGPLVTHTFNFNGTSLAVVLRVTDRSGMWSTDTTWVNVTESIPIANFHPSVASPFEGDNVTFIDQSTSPGSDNITSWYWEFGDDTTNTTQYPVKSYETSGTYVVNLTVTDDDGDSSERHSVQISVQNRPLEASFTLPSGLYTEGDTVHFISTSHPTYSGDEITNWTWNFHDGSNL
jgi:PKD repeat protein